MLRFSLQWINEFRFSFVHQIPRYSLWVNEFLDFAVPILPCTRWIIRDAHTHMTYHGLGRTSWSILKHGLLSYLLHTKRSILAISWLHWGDWEGPPPLPSKLRQDRFIPPTFASGNIPDYASTQQRASLKFTVEQFLPSHLKRCRNSSLLPQGNQEQLLRVKSSMGRLGWLRKSGISILQSAWTACNKINPDSWRKRIQLFNALLQV